MELSDAILVAIAGISVVFFGLIVTNLLILSLPRLAKFGDLFKSSPKKAETESPAVAETEVKTLAEADPETVAVISALLEIERRLSFSQRASRYTFKSRNTSRTGLVR